ncbi:DUF4278 domain-containing protein [Pleurocapsa sp. FMAR1]|uniref:DUF4278 domain-containing protein n=1 Tax=Pleurocapsa sp. FMAR1 TaxID=3040204 RepID=UPI0029C6B175|nr:DUF4278 domain-containing protein [Pleurocapsa sp. FMAR1]
MKLTYRGVPYNEEHQTLSAPAVIVENREIIYRGNSLSARINPKFPWLNYIKQLFQKSELRVFDPIAFWYDHKREFIQDCWNLDHIEKLDCAWNLTLQIEKSKTLKQQKTKLKYRGVTYYK